MMKHTPCKVLALALALALCMLFEAAAFAENTTTVTENNKTGVTEVSCTIESCSDFVLTIPAAITIDPEVASSDLKVDLDASKYNLTEKMICVGVHTSGNTFKLTHETDADAYISYKLNMDNGTSNGDNLGIGRAFITYTYDPSSTAARGASVTLHVNADKTQIQNAIAGEYKGEVTFKVYLSSF